MKRAPLNKILEGLKVPTINQTDEFILKSKKQDKSTQKKSWGPGVLSNPWIHHWLSVPASYIDVIKPLKKYRTIHNDILLIPKFN